jgi:hypothetical protein
MQIIGVSGVGSGEGLFAESPSTVPLQELMGFAAAFTRSLARIRRVAAFRGFRVFS